MYREKHYLKQFRFTRTHDLGSLAQYLCNNYFDDFKKCTESIYTPDKFRVDFHNELLQSDRDYIQTCYHSSTRTNFSKFPLFLIIHPEFPES